MAFNSADTAAFKNVWVFCEQRQGKMMPTTFELISEGRKLADELGVELCGILLRAEEDGQLEIQLDEETSVTVEKITPKQSTTAPLRKKCLRGFFCFPCWGSSTTFSRAACCSSLRGSRSGSASSRTVLSLRSSNRERS